MTGLKMAVNSQVKGVLHGREQLVGGQPQTSVGAAKIQQRLQERTIVSVMPTVPCIWHGLTPLPSLSYKDG